jgi:hypothetical protein
VELETLVQGWSIVYLHDALAPGIDSFDTAHFKGQIPACLLPVFTLWWAAVFVCLCVCVLERVYEQETRRERAGERVKSVYYPLRPWLANLSVNKYMPFSRRFYPKQLTVMCAYILRMGGPGDQTHYPGVTSAMLYQLKDQQISYSSRGEWGMLSYVLHSASLHQGKYSILCHKNIYIQYISECCASP